MTTTTSPPFRGLVPLELDPAPQCDSAELVARLKHAVGDNRQTTCHFVALWEYPSGYYNIGTYLVEIEVSADTTERDVIVKWGPHIICWKRNVGPEEEVSEALRDYAEAFHGHIIEPTREQMAGFRSWYLVQLEQWAQCVMRAEAEDMLDPSRLSVYEIMDAVFARMSVEGQRACRRARCRWYVLDAHMRASRSYMPLAVYIRGLPFQAEIECIEQAHRQTKARLFEWWKGSRYVDYALPPPAADTLHDTRRVLASFPYRTTTYRRVEVWGQIACCPDMLPVYTPGDPNAKQPGVRLIHPTSGREVCHFLLPSPLPASGTLCECVRECARRISRLVDLSRCAENALTAPQWRGAMLGLDAILQQTVLGAHRICCHGGALPPGSE